MERIIRTVATVASLVVLAGFAAFALDQLRTASKRTQDELAGVHAADPTERQENARERRHSRVREWLDDANDILLAPFAWAGDGADDRWVRRGLPALVALVVYGFGLGFLARFARGFP
jgi:hypothetical protein